MLKLRETEQALQTEIEKRNQAENALKALEEQFRTLEESMLARLRQAQRMEAIGTLASGIAHDFNNILAVISGNCELAALVSKPDSPVHQFLNAIDSAGERAKDLVQQIMTFARKNEAVQKPILIHIVLNEALKLLRASLPSTIEFTLDICREMNYVMADVVQIYQIIVALCLNAAQAMEEEGGMLSVSLSQLNFDPEMVARFSDLQAGPHLKMVISDTGRGIDPEALDHLFNSHPFAPDRKVEIKLGLPEIKDIIKNHNGQIIAHSKAGKGTTFTIFLPLIETASEKDSDKNSSTPTGNERLLFVDDEFHLAQVGREMFASLGYQVSSFVESRKAWDAFKCSPDRFDLVITDMTMPHMSGRTLARNIQDLRPDIPIILCSGHPSAGQSEDSARLAGIRAVMTKPYGLSELAITVRRLLDNPV